MHSDTLITQVRLALGLSRLTLRTSPEWGSQRLGNRLRIREDLSARAGENLLDLETIPNLGTGSVSISHHRERGGYIMSDSTDLGFDMELNARVREDLLERVLVRESERSAAPSAAALWTAKEAAYKCLKQIAQPRGLADVEIGNWQPLGPGAFSCGVVSDQLATVGVIFEVANESPSKGETWAFFRGIQRCVGY